MAKRKKPFHKLWTSRFCEAHRLDADTIHTWHTQLIAECGDKNWTRLIISNWQDKPISSVADAHAIVCWLAEAADPQVFVTKRGISHISVGLQVWCTSPDVQLLVHMMAAPVKQVSSYTPEQFAEHMFTMLTWIRPS